MSAATVIATAGAAAGTGPTVTVSSASNDSGGSIALTIGTSPTTGILLTFSLFSWSGFVPITKIIAWTAFCTTKGSGSTTNLGPAVNVYPSATGQTANSSCPSAAVQLSTSVAFTAGDVITINYTVPS